MTENSESLSESIVQIRDRNFVEAERDGKPTAFARRADEWSDWEVAFLDSVTGYWRQDVVRVHNTLPEVVQRKVILAILKEIG